MFYLTSFSQIYLSLEGQSGCDILFFYCFSTAPVFSCEGMHNLISEILWRDFYSEAAATVPAGRVFPGKEGEKERKKTPKLDFPPSKWQIKVFLFNSIWRKQRQPEMDRERERARASERERGREQPHAREKKKKQEGG